MLQAFFICLLQTGFVGASEESTPAAEAATPLIEKKYEEMHANEMRVVAARCPVYHFKTGIAPSSARGKHTA